MYEWNDEMESELICTRQKRKYWTRPRFYLACLHTDTYITHPACRWLSTSSESLKYDSYIDGDTDAKEEDTARGTFRSNVYKHGGDNGECDACALWSSLVLIEEWTIMFLLFVTSAAIELRSHNTSTYERTWYLMLSNLCPESLLNVTADEYPSFTLRDITFHYETSQTRVTITNSWYYLF